MKHCLARKIVNEQQKKKLDFPIGIEPMSKAEADAEVERFFATLEEQLKGVPEAEIERGAKKVHDFIQGKINWAELFSFTPEMLFQIAEYGFTQFKTGRYEDAERVEVPDYGHRLPDEIAKYTLHGVYDEEHEHTSFIQGAGHGGSHPHLMHEFVSAILEGRESSVDAENWTMAGICAHESAMRGGERITIPSP